MAMKSGLTLTELEERIAAVRENLRELSEQAAANSGAGDEDLNAARIAEQEKELGRVHRAPGNLAAKVTAEDRGSF